MNKMFLVFMIDDQRRCGHASHQTTGGVLCSYQPIATVLLLLSVGCHDAASDLSSLMLIELTDANFQQEVVQANQPVLVEFWAPWCQPCLEMVPDVEKVAARFSGRAKVARIRIDENPATASAYNVDKPPAVIVFRDGELVKRRHGKQTAEDLVALVSASLSD